MTDPRPLRLREGHPATDIVAADGSLLATIYPQNTARIARAAPNSFLLLRAYEDAEAIAAAIVHAFNAHAELVAFVEKVRSVSLSHVEEDDDGEIEALAGDAAALLGRVRSSDGLPGATGR